MEIATRRREQEVWQACDDLWAQAGDFSFITGDAIRERLMELGKSRGSPNEIYKYRKTWVSSRGINSGGSQGSNSEAASDPISRAVKIVHEKLQEEASESIAAINKNHENELQKKDEEIDELKNSLNKLVKEFEILTKAHLETQSELGVCKNQLSSEIQVRQAVERERLNLKTEAQIKEKAHEQIINEQIKTHQQACEVIREAFKLGTSKLESTIEALEAEKKAMGIEFSEQLTQEKIGKHQTQLHVKELQNENAKANDKLILLSDELKKSLAIIADKEKSQQVLEAKLSELNLMLANKDKELSLLNRKLLKVNISVARLRAMNNLK